MQRRMFMLAVAALIASGLAFAQQSQPTQPTGQRQSNQPAPTIGERRQDQQDRIANGMDSGQLTAGESRNLESREANVNREISADRAGDNGHLTPAERQKINHQQNNMSHSIYQDKHNAAQAHYGNSEVGQRQQRQQDRIANGVRNDKMTAGEAARDGHNPGFSGQNESNNRDVGRPNFG